MNTPTGGRARPNDDSELERFKDHIPLVPLATSRYGYDVTDKARNDSWHKLEKAGEVLIVSKRDGRDVYMNAHDTKDSGSVVDFVKTRDGLNLGQVRQQLRQYLGEGGPEQDRQQLAARPEPSRTRQAERGPDATLPEDPVQRRDELLRRTLGVQPALTDRSYLRERGLSDDTINAPAFQGRVFTGQNGPHKNTVFPLINEGGFSSYEERNHNFKSQMPGPRDGIWASHPTQGKGTAVERIVIGESPIDAMSKYQLEQAGGAGPNTMYLTSSGTVSQRQVELMQKVIDRQQPKEVVLANDNDAAGVRFNLNYLNDFRVPRQQLALETGAETAEQQRGGVTWRAMRAGDYHTDLKITFETERQREGRAAVAGLPEKVDGWKKEGGEQAAALEVVRMGSDQTVARVTVTNDQLPQLRGLVQELQAQREAALPEAQRTPPEFFKWEAARSKDFNQDLTDQLTEQRLQRAREQAGFDKAPAPLQVAPSPVERPIQVQIVEQNQPQPGGGTAAQIEQDLLKAGLRITARTQQIDEASGARTTQLQGQYIVTDPEAQRRAINTQLEIIRQAPGVTLTETEAHAQERRGLPSAPPLQQQELPERQLAESKAQFSAATRELGQRLEQHGVGLDAARLQELSRNVQERDILPLRGVDRQNLDGALGVAQQMPALLEKGQPGPLILAVQQADKTLHERYQVVQELGGTGTQRGTIAVLDEKASQENRAVQVWKDLKAEGAGVSNIVQRETAPGMMERRIEFKYDPTPGASVAGVEAVLRAAERSPGIQVEEPAQAREVRQRAAAAHQQTELEAGRTPSPARGGYPSNSPEWVTYAVTSTAPAGSPELKAQTEEIKKAGGVVVPLAGQAQGEQTQLVSFHLQDPRLGAISEATRQMSENGGNRYDVERRIAVGEAGGWAAGIVRLTEAQEAALRTPQILDDLRANGVFIQNQRPLPAPEGLVREEIRIAYQTEQNPVGVATVLDALKRSPGIEVEEAARQQQAREALAAAERERQALLQAQEATRQAELRQQQAQQEMQRQQAERERLANSPEAQRQREQEDRLLTAGILTAAAAAQQREPGVHTHPMVGLDQLFREKAMEAAGTKAPAYEEVPRSMREPDGTHPVRYTQLQVGLEPEEGKRLQQAMQQLQQAGATPGQLQQDIVKVDSVMIGYRLDQPELPQIHRQLAQIQQQGEVRVIESPERLAEREQELARRGIETAGPKAPAFDVATEQQRTPALDHPYRYAEINMGAAGYNEDKLRVLRKEFEQAGASVTAVEPHRDMAGRDQLRIMVGYRIDQPELPQITEQLRAAQQADNVLYKERGGQAMERSHELERRQREPGVALQFAPEASRPAEQQREAAQLSGTSAVAAEKVQQSKEYYPAEGWKTQVLRDRRDDELAPVAAQLITVGAQVGGTVPDGAGGRSMTISYHPAAVQQDKVLEVIETHRAAREVAGPQPVPVAAQERTPERTPEPAAARTPERVVEPVTVHQPAVATTTTSVSEQPFRHVGISVLEEGAQQRAQQLREQLQQQGALVTEVKQQEAGREFTRSSFTASYALGPQSAGVAQALESAGRQPGISLQESLEQQRERQQRFAGEVPPISGTVVAPTTGYAGGPPQGPAQWQQGVVLVRENDEERGRTAAVREALQKAGASIGAGGERHDGVAGGAIRYSYHPQQENLEKVNKVLDSAMKSEGIEVREQKPQQPGPELEPRNGKFNQAIIAIDDTPEKGKARAENIGGDLSKGGAIVGEAKVVNGHVEMPVSYHTRTPNLQQINQTLDRAAGSSGVQVLENGEDRGARLQEARAAAQDRTPAGAGMERERG